MTKVYLSLGSNLGDRMANLVAAVRALEGTGRVVALSPVYETAPLGPDGSIVADQPAYLNCVVAVETTLDAHTLRGRTGAIEAALGRERRERWQPRSIDIDIALFGNDRVDTPNLVVPHPRMHARAFVVRPLLDLDPELAAPGLGPLGPMAARLDWQDVREFVGADEFLARVAGTIRREDSR